MPNRTGRVLFCIFLVCVAAAAILMARQWPFQTALFPLAVSIPLLILATIQLLQLISGRADADEGDTVDLEFASDVPPEIASRRALAGFSWIIGFILGVYLVGFPLTVPLFIFAYLKFQSSVGWLYSVLSTALTWAIFYGLFQRLVHLQFEQGALQAWLGL
jgi:hypothetical protein